jgi:diguanylate cyclase (GGDEF)-like protein
LIEALGMPKNGPVNGGQPAPQQQSFGEQLSSQNSNMFSMATLNLIITITFLMQGSLIAVSARVIKAYKGVREASIATFALAFGFLVITGGQPNPLTGYLSNLFRACGFFLIYLAICRFTSVAFNHILVYGFFPIGVITLTFFSIFHLQPLLEVYTELIVGIVFVISSVIVLFRSDRRRFKLSAYLTAIPFLIYAFVMIGQLIAGIISQRELLPTPSLTGRISVLLLFILSYLWTAGFILMVSQRLQSDLNDLAMNDALTRVRNRRAMQEMLNFEMRRVDKEVKDFSIILLDVDHFKKVNDTYGHDVGDIVLQWLASTLQVNMRVQDVVARWGGEEFLILLPDTTLDEAVEIAERLRFLVDSSSVETPSEPLHITFSGGVSSSTTTRSVDELCKIADQALYIAKETRNRVVSQNVIPASESP